MDSLITGSIDGHFFMTCLSIIIIDLVLSGDNSVVIALAVRSLSPDKRMKGIIFGILAAVSLRVSFTWFASNLMQTPFLKLVGGALILWIAVKLLVEQAGAEAPVKKAESLWQSVWIILVADVTMSLDNVLAVAGVSGGNALQLWISLGITIPMIVFSSTLTSRLMDRYPIILYMGAAILGKVGGGMIITDPGLVSWFKLDSPLFRYGVEAFCIVGVLAVAMWLKRRMAVDEISSPP
ncbi:MAG: TerC family protein [Fibrobacterota bacterium]|nr:TerC family protein [Fibrobacterota bacterium]